MHRILEFNREGGCIAEHHIVPNDQDDISTTFTWSKDAYKAQWQFYKEGFGWQGYSNYYR